MNDARDSNRVSCLFLAYVALRLEVTTIFDICGACTWQRSLMSLLPQCEYIGLALSNSAVQCAQSRCSANMKVVPEPLDVIEDDLRSYVKQQSEGEALFIVKEIIQTVSVEKGKKLLRNIKASGVRYLAVTHYDTGCNIKSGDSYENNMYTTPFDFHYPLFDISYCLPAHLRRSMGNLVIFDLQREEV